MPRNFLKLQVESLASVAICLFRNLSSFSAFLRARSRHRHRHAQLKNIIKAENGKFCFSLASPVSHNVYFEDAKRTKKFRACWQVILENFENVLT